MEEVAEILPTAHSVLNIENIDKDDGENPQLVVEYVNEIYAYLRHLENVQNVREKYLSGKNVSNTSIMPKMRGVLVDWLIQVHQQFNLLQETLYLTVAILDRFLGPHFKIWTVWALNIALVLFWVCFGPQKTQILFSDPEHDPSVLRLACGAMLGPFGTILGQYKREKWTLKLILGVFWPLFWAPKSIYHILG